VTEEAAEDALPIWLQRGQHLVLGGKVLRVIGAWQETEASDGRARWGIVTEGEEQPVPPAEATAREPMKIRGIGEPFQGSITRAMAPEACRKCGRQFRLDGKFVDSAARYADTPFCRTCAGRCYDSEIADHWCDIDQYRQDQQSGKVVEPAPARLAVTPVPCVHPGCGEGPAAHLGWELGHVYTER